MKKKLLLILVLAVIVLPMLLPLPVMAADPWLTGWQYRKDHNLVGAAGAGTGYQVMLTVHSGAGADSGNVVYLNGHCTNFPHDITFTDDDDTTELDYFCEDLTADPATFWIEVDDDLSSGTVPVDIYYGKLGQDSKSNGFATFPLLYDGWDLTIYGSWSTATALPTVRYAIGPSELPSYSGNIYIIGGWNATGRCADVTIYNVAGDSYSGGAYYPDVGIAGSAQVQYNGRIYVFGGVTQSTGWYTDNTRIYDIAADAWSSGASVPWAAEGMLATVDTTTGLIYVGGGCEMSAALHDEWYSYNPVLDTWTELETFPHTRGNGATVYYNGNIYTTAGAGITGTTILDTTWRYNIADDEWFTDLATIATPTNLPANGFDSTNGLIYLFGGRTSPTAHVYTNEVQVYDIDNDLWLNENEDYTYSSVPASYGFASGTLNATTYYLAGGWDGSNKYNTMRMDDLSVTTQGGIDAGRWTNNGATVSNGILTLNATGEYLRSVGTFQYKALRYSANVSSVGAPSSATMTGFQENLIGSLDYAIFSARNSTLAWAMSEDGASWEYTSVPTSYDAYHTFDVMWVASNVTHRIDNVVVASTSNVTTIPNNVIPLAFYTYSPVIDLDWVFVRKFVNPEPTHGAWGAEEECPSPIIYTVDASRIACTTARLNSVLVWDGSLPVIVQFGWGNATSATIAGYQYSQTLSGTYSKDSHPLLDISSLNMSTLYYFRVQGTNDNGSYLGAELTFVTTNLTGTPQNFNGIPSDDSISLWWDPLPGASNYLIRYKAGGYPTGTTDGTEVYFDTSASTVHEDLTPGTTYYYMLWGESGGTYSSNATLMLTTTAGAGPGMTPDYTSPTEIPRWLGGTDYTNVAGLGFVYDITNNVADALAIPRGNFWFATWMILSVVVGLVVYVVSKGKLMIATMVMTTLLVIGWLMMLVPGWIPVIGGIIIIASFVAHREVSARG